MRGKLWLITVLVLVASLVWPLPTVPAAIEVGEAAPNMALDDESGRAADLLQAVDPGDDATSVVTMLLFVKPDDRYASNTVAALNELFTRQPELAKKLDRAVVMTRSNGLKPPKIPPNVNRKHWRVLMDSGNDAYLEYKIIATPTIILVTPDRKVAAVHAGYDSGMPQDVRLALAKLLGVALPRATTQAPEKPNMMLQMARQMAKRGQWERALDYYERAAAEGSLPAEVALEKAAVYIELGDAERAGTELNAVKESEVDAARLAMLKQRASELKQKQDGAPIPPKINR